MEEDINCDDFDLMRELLETKKESIESALDLVGTVVEDDTKELPDDMKKKISNVQSLLQDIAEFYEEAANTEYEEVSA